MNKTKDKIEAITDELMTTNHEASVVDDPAYKLMKQMNVSGEINRIAEGMREDILGEVNTRIDKTKRKELWIRIASIAASIALLLGITNYLSYKQGYAQQNSQIAQIVNPLGMRSSIVLSDGTKVFLNAGTVLNYPTAFISKNRVVEIEGEAFFEVAHNADHPFIVKTGNLNIHVLGTKFNVKTYKEENHVEVTLEEGKVEVGIEGRNNFHILNPKEQISFNKSTQSFSKKQVIINHYISWKEGRFYFNSVTFKEIAKQLERRFNVQIHIDSNELGQTIFTGDFVRQENLEQILRVMTIDKRIHYKIEGDQVYIK